MKRAFLSFFVLNILFLFTGINSRVYADLEEGEEEFAPVLQMYNSTADPDCPDPNPATGISYVCGYVKTNTIEHVIPGDETSSRITGKPIVGAVVSVCEALYTPTGKTSEGMGGEVDCTNAYRGVTNELGFFRIPMPMVGAAANTMYTIVSCNGQPVVSKKLNSVYSHLLSFKINCPADLTPIKPPDKIDLASNRSSYLTCETPGLKTVFENAVENILSSVFSHPIGYTQPFEDRVDTVHYERQFDIRYACLGSRYCTTYGRFGNPFILEPHDGAWWSYDCVRRPGGLDSFGNNVACYTDRPATDYITPNSGANFWSSAPIHIDIYNLGNLEGNLRNYMTANTLDTLPLDPVLPLYRRFEHRYGILGLQQFGNAPASFVQNMFGNPTVYVRHLKNGETQTDDMLIPCERFRLGKEVISSDTTVPVNSYITGGPAVGLSTPTNWEQIYLKILREDAQRSEDNRFMNTVVCQQNGNPITISQIEPPTSWLEVPRVGGYALDENYFHPFVLLDKYPGVENKTADSNHNSPQTGDWLPRTNQYGLVETEAGGGTGTGVQDGGAHMVVIPEDPSHASSVGTAFSLTQDEAYVEGGALTDNINLPFPDEEEIQPIDNIEWDIGMGLLNHCSKPQYANDTGEINFIDNTVNSILNPDEDPQISNDTVSTQVYYTAFSLIRDELLQLRPENDRIDSYMSIFEADDDKLAFSLGLGSDVAGQILYWIANAHRLSIHGEGPQKTFYERTRMDASGIKVVPLTIDYTSLNEDNFADIFPSGRYLPLPEGNPRGTGGLGSHPEYPWNNVPEGQACNAWGNQYAESGGTSACNADPNCLRTCRLDLDDTITHEGREVTGCLRVFRSYTYRNDGFSCTVFDNGISDDECTPEEMFGCVLRGRTEFPDPPDPDNMPDPLQVVPACCNPGEECLPGNTKSYEGDSVYWCVVEHAGPYQGTFDLDNQAAHFRSQQENAPVIENTFHKEQKPLDNVIEDGNYWVDAMRAPYTPKKQTQGAALSYYDNNKRGGVAMSAKDTIRVGDTGATDYFTSIAADPIFSDASVDDEVESELQTDESSISSRVVPVINAEDVLSTINDSCAIHTCTLSDTSRAPSHQDYSSLYQILNAAGSAYNVPAKLLLTFMYAEGSLRDYEWNNINTYRWSIPVGGTVQKSGFLSACDDLSWADIGVIPKFLNQWNGGTNPTRQCSGDPYSTSDPIKCGVDAVAPGRGSVARRCNLLDAAYAFARDAWLTGGQPGSCGEWDEDRYMQVLNQWAVVGGLGGTTGDEAYNDLMWEPINSCN